MHVDAVRRFNRFYTRRVGALRAGLLGSPYPLPEARLVYEIGHRGRCTASELAAERAAEDARSSVLSLTGKGRRAYALLDSRSREDVSAMLRALPGGERERLV